MPVAPRSLIFCGHTGCCNVSHGVQRQHLPDITEADVELLRDLGIFAAEDSAQGKTRNSGSLTSSLSSGGGHPDESSAIDTARSMRQEQEGSGDGMVANSAGYIDRIQVRL